MSAPYENSGPGSRASAIGFGIVWTAGIILSLPTLRLAVSGFLWNLGFPSWLITLIVLVGIWQWLWILPMLRLARRRNRQALYNGLLSGGISFSALHLTVCLMLYFTFRKFSLQ